MKLEIQESYEGELKDDSQKVRDKANRALQSALDAVGVPRCCGGLEKALTSKTEERIGEMQVLEDLTKNLASMYEERLYLLSQDLEERIGAQDESE